MKSKLKSAREMLTVVELEEHSFPPDELPGFYAGWEIAAAGDLDLCQGVIDRLNDTLSVGAENPGLAAAKFVGWAAYHRELINLLARGE